MTFESLCIILIASCLLSIFIRKSFKAGKPNIRKESIGIYIGSKRNIFLIYHTTLTIVFVTLKIGSELTNKIMLFALVSSFVLNTVLGEESE